MDDERNPEDGVLGLSTKVIDHLRDDIGMSVHFPAGESVAIIPPDTLNKICGTVTTRQIMPTGFTIHGGDNNGDEPLHATISFGGANGTKPEPLNTVDRVFAIHAGGSGEHASCAAAHAVLPIGQSNNHGSKIKLADLKSAGHSGASATVANADEEGRVAVKQAVCWQGAINASKTDIMHGCISGSKGDIERVMVPLMTAPGNRSQLATLCNRAHTEKTLQQLVGIHHVTSSIHNDTLGASVPHAVMSKAAADRACNALWENLQGGALANGLTVSLTGATGAPPSGDSHIRLTMHRNPAKPDGVDIPEHGVLTKALAGSQEAGSAFDTAALGPDQGFHAEMFSSGINVGDGIGLQTIDSSSTPTAGGGDAQVQRHNAEAADDQVDVN